MRRPLEILGISVGVVLALYCLGVWMFGYCTTIAESHGENHTVVVRRLQARQTPIAYLFNTSPVYRCELYMKGSSTIESAYTYRGESLYANEAEVEWTARGEAIVNIGGEPAVFCDQWRLWRPIRELSPEPRLETSTP